VPDRPFRIGAIPRPPSYEQPEQAYGKGQSAGHAAQAMGSKGPLAH